MLIEKENIESLIPQRPPFVMVDSLVDAAENGFKTQFEITSNNLFIQNSILSESALLENVAQTCAAGFGYLGSLEAESEPRIGYIGAITNVVNIDSAKVGDILETEVVIINSFDAIHLVEGKVSTKGKELLTCQLKIVLA